MKKILTAALIAVTGLSFAACGVIGGSFKLTGMPQGSNGKYAVVYAARMDAGVVLVGVKSFNILTKSVTLSRIRNGSVSVPMWKTNKSNIPIRYLGNDTLIVMVGIMDSEKMDSTDPSVILSRMKGANTFLSTKFTNGGASEAWSKGMGGGMLGNMLKGLSF
jgi:hypothetical protein